MKRFLLACALVPFALRAQADAMFDKGVAVAELAEELVGAFNSQSVAAVLGKFDVAANVRFYWREAASVGFADIQASLQQLMDDHAGDAFDAESPRVLTGSRTAWLMFDWKWNGDAGSLIARVSKNGRRWRILDLDLTGETVSNPPPDFDTKTASDTINAPILTMERAAKAMNDGDLNALETLMTQEFEFIDGAGDLFQGAEALLIAAFAPIPDGISREEMTLFVSPDAERAIAFQDIDGQRVSLTLERLEGWKVTAASLSVRFETLAVSAVGRKRTTWSALKNR